MNDQKFLEAKLGGEPGRIEGAPRPETRGVVAYPPSGEIGRIMSVARVLEPAGAIVVTHRISAPGQMPRTRVSLESYEVGGAGRLGLVLDLAFAGARFGPPCAPEAPAPLAFTLKPMALDIDEDEITTPSPLRLVRAQKRDSDMPLICRAPAHAPNVESALALIVASGRAELEIKLRKVMVGPALAAALESLRARLIARSYRKGGEQDDAGDTAMALVGALLREGWGLRLEARVGFWDQPDPFLLDLICEALFGAGPSDPEAWGGQKPPTVDLRGVGVNSMIAPRLLPSAETIQRLLSAAPQLERAHESGDLVVGRDGADQSVTLLRKDRETHTLVLGASGTGKSTLLLNLLAQDFANREGMILVDPAGDLADDALKLVPASRRSDVIFADAGADDGVYSLNVFSGQGADPAMARNQSANALVRILKEVLYGDIKEAFGPMFEMYFRNAFLLLSEAEGEAACLTHFDKIFFDEDWRNHLLQKCKDAKVIEFWKDIPRRVTNQDITLENIAPYIISKLTRLTGDPTLRRIIAPRGRAIDFGAVMNEGKICILKIPAGIGRAEAELIGALTLLEIQKAAMGRGALSRSARRPCRLFVDEIQTIPGDGLAEMLAESRKFGISLVLATQGLARIDGVRGRPNIGPSALANSSSIISLRVGAPDAMILGPWFAPDIDWDVLCKTPNHHAVVKLLQQGRPLPATVLRLAPPPEAAQQTSS
jgi:hypothetical protein